MLTTSILIIIFIAMIFIYSVIYFIASSKISKQGLYFTDFSLIMTGLVISLLSGGSTFLISTYML